MCLKVKQQMLIPKSIFSSVSYILVSNKAGRQKYINDDGLPSDVRTAKESMTGDGERKKDPLRRNMRTDDERRQLEVDLQNELQKLMETEMVITPSKDSSCSSC